MTSAQPIAVLLQPYLQQGLSLWLEGDMLRFKASKELMTPALMALLKQNKQAIIDWLRAESVATESAPVLVDEFPLASTQAAIWMLYRFAPGSPAYNTTFACTIKGELNETAVRQAFHALMIRHPILRTTFADTDHGPRQQVWNHMPMPLQLVEGAAWTEAELDAWLQQEADAPFDLTTQCCLRVKIVRNSVRGNILIATIQHVGADLWALLIVAKDIKEFYQRAAKGEVLSLEQTTVSYRQHVEWQQRFLLSDQGKAMRRFWQRALQGAPTRISFATDFPRPPVLQLKTALIKQQLGGAQYRDIKASCKASSVTAFAFLQTALQLLVYQNTGAADFLLGTPTMGRSQKGMDQVVGDFANPVVLRTRLQPQQTLRSALLATKRNLLDAMTHQDYPFPAVVQDCNPPRDSSRTPLFQIMFVWHQGNADLLAQDDWIDQVLPLSGPRGAPYDVMLAVSDLGDHFELNWTYQTSLYRSDTIGRLISEMAVIVECMLLSVDNTVAQCLASGNVSHQRINQPPAEHGQGGDDSTVLHATLRASTLIEQTLEDGRKVLRLFAESPESHWTVWPNSLCQNNAPIDDVRVVPNLPRLLTGEVNAQALRQWPLIDHQRLREDILRIGLQPDDVVLVQEQHIIPTAEPAELTAFLHQAKPAVKAATVDTSARPDAWVVGAPLAPESDAPHHLFTALCRTAERFPERGLTLLNDNRIATEYRYSQLVDDARRVAAALRQSGLEPGSILLLQMRFDQRFFAVWWGALLAGLLPLNVATPEHYSNRNGVAQKLYNVAHNYTGLTVAADQERVAATRAWLGDSKAVMDADSLLQFPSRYDGEPGENPVAFLQLTSGSTGTPKAIQITHQGILHHIVASASHNGYRDSDVNLNWLPFDHVVPILTTHIKDCVLGIQQIQLTTSSVLADPLWWLQAMSDYGVTHSWAPNFAFQRVVDALQARTEPLAIHLDKVKFLMNAGEQVLAPVVQRFSALCAPLGLGADCVQPAFGMAEACTCITYNNDSSRTLSIHFNPANDGSVCAITEPHLATHGFVDLGTLMPGVEIRITNEHNELVKEGVIGRMQIRGPVVTPGYLNNPAANEEAFVGEGWFNSGDLGFIWNKRLILTGREKEMIVVNGANFYCFELEQAATLPGVLPTFVAATGVALDAGANSDALVLFYVADGSVDSIVLERQMSARVAETFGLAPTFVLPVERDNFFKTTSGKIQRGQFKKNFEKQLYADDAEAYLSRHRKHDDQADTLFSLHWEQRCTDEPAENKSELFIWSAADLNPAETLQNWQHDCVTLLPLHGPDLQRRLAADSDVQASTQSAIHSKVPSGHVLLLGEIPDQRGGDVLSLPTCLLRMTQQCAQLKQVLLALPAGFSPRLLIAVIGHTRDDVLLLQPLLETLRQETGFPQLRGCVIKRNADVRLLANAWTAPVRQVCWIEGTEVTRPLLQAVNLNARHTPALLRNGVYVITGGLGGLAEPLCQYLVQRHRCRIVLLGRTPLADSPSHQYRFAQWQQQLGPSALQYHAVRDWSATHLNTVLSAALRAFGARNVDGVFHLAGHLEMCELEHIDSSHWHQQTDPKHTLSRSLKQYLQQYAPQAILVHYSSLNACFGGQQAAAYSIANALQSHQTSNQQQGDVRTWCLHWSVWSNTGMASRFTTSELQLARNKGMLPLDKARDLFWLEAVLALAPGNYYAGIDPDAGAMRDVLDFNVQSRQLFHAQLQQTANGQGLDASRWLIDPSGCVDTVRLEQHRWHQSWPRSSDGAIDVVQLQQTASAHHEEQVPPQNIAEQTLLQIWSAVLNRAIPDVSRSFFEYGGHSINATQLIAAVNQQFGKSLTVAHLFQYPTIRGMAELIGEKAASTNTLSLGLADFIGRADDYRLDCINPDSTATLNIVFLPTASGLASAYLMLMSQAQSARLHVLGMPFAQQEPDSIAIAADYFVRLMEQSGLDGGNTWLVGWSMGGVLGYEMLTQLHRQQKKLPQLLMLDSGFGPGLHPITFDDQFQLLMFAVELGLAPEKFAEFNQQADTVEKLGWLQQFLSTISIEVTQPMLIEWSETYRTRLRQLEHYCIEQETLPTDITLIKADWHSHGRTDLGWGETNKNIKWQSVATDHQGIIKHPDVANWLRQHCL